MPIFEFKCSQCGLLFEKLIRSKQAKANCPECGSKKVEKQFSTFAAQGGQSAKPCDSGSCPMSDGAPPCCSGGSCGLR